MSVMSVLSPISNVGNGGDKGATKDQKNINALQQEFQQTLVQDFGTTFAGQQNIINGLTKSLTSTLNGGPSQFGFSAPETTALNTLATSANSQAYQNARAAAGEAAAAQGQGGATLPTGVAGATEAQIAEEAAKNQSNELLGIQEAGYKQGAENYKEAVSGLTSTAGLENPTGYAGQATSAGDAAAGEANTIQKTNVAASPWGQVGGLVGSLAGAAVNTFLPGAGAIGPAIGAGTSTLGSLGKGTLDFSPAQGDTTNYSQWNFGNGS